MKKSGFLLISALAMMAILPSGTSRAQQPGEPVYIVQEGDSLWEIAARFDVPLDELESANNITNPNQLTVGAQLIIPGLEGFQGVLTTTTIPYGESLQSLSRTYGIPQNDLARLNHLASPAQLYAGASLVILQQDQLQAAGKRITLAPGESLLELAASQDLNPYELVSSNLISETWSIIPGEVLVSRNEQNASDPTSPGALPESIISIKVEPSPLVQGKASVMRVLGAKGLVLSGSLAGNELHFFPSPDGGYVALQGVYAFQEPGLYPLVIHGNLPESYADNATNFSFSQDVLIRQGDFVFDPPLTVDSELVDPAVTTPEEKQWFSLAQKATPEKLWTGAFQSPIEPPFDQCWPSTFGDRRSYNGSAYTYFHSGLDFCGRIGTEIHAPAAGKVVYTGSMEIRGNVTLIDHGWGVYSGYFHQSEILVEVGDMVEPGQVIGLVGDTGRVTGPHLHWEMIVGDVQVDPMDWLKTEFP
jgi:murein DD-endopeptidase MepM/ murein hydrolase activator NlpD